MDAATPLCSKSFPRAFGEDHDWQERLPGLRPVEPGPATSVSHTSEGLRSPWKHLQGGQPFASVLQGCQHRSRDGSENQSSTQRSWSRHHLGPADFDRPSTKRSRVRWTSWAPPAALATRLCERAYDQPGRDLRRLEPRMSTRRLPRRQREVSSRTGLSPPGPGSNRVAGASRECRTGPPGHTTTALHPGHTTMDGSRSCHPAV